MTTVLIVGESEVMRKGLESLVASDPSLASVGSLDDLSELDEFVREASPAVVLVASDANTLEIVDDLARSTSAADALRTAFVFLGPATAAHSAAEAFRSGIAALLPQEATGEEILAAVHAAAAGLVVVHPSMLESEGERRRPRPLGAPVSPLTPRELEILGMVAEGLGNKEIAWRLKISEHTVKFHLTSIFTKLDASSRAEAVSLGFRLGLILM